MSGAKRIFALFFSLLLLAGLGACDLSNSPTAPFEGGQIGGGNGDGYSGNRGSPAEIEDGSLWEWTYVPTSVASHNTDVTAVHAFNEPESNGVKKIRVVVDRGNQTTNFEMTLATTAPEVWSDGTGNSLQLSDANKNYDEPMITLIVSGTPTIISLDPDVDSPKAVR